MTAIRAVHAGDYFVSPAVGCKLVQRAQEGVQMGRRDASRHHGELNFIQSKFESLTRREAEILHLLLRDFDNREIAEQLFIAEQTVRNHVSVIYTKLGVQRSHARQARRQGPPQDAVSSTHVPGAAKRDPGTMPAASRCSATSASS